MTATRGPHGGKCSSLSACTPDDGLPVRAPMNGFNEQLVLDSNPSLAPKWGTLPLHRANRGPRYSRCRTHGNIFALMWGCASLRMNPLGHEQVLCFPQ